jgi:hypothetical protein
MSAEQLTPEEAEAMLERLSEHFRVPVQPVSRYCDSLRTWARCIRERDGGRSDLCQAIDRAEMEIRKSSLLARLIYGGEPLRTRVCPVHKGRWSGLAPCPHGCESTGWVREDWPDGAPRCTRHPDRPAVSRTVSVHAATDDCFECYQERWESFAATTTAPQGAEGEG